jgi:hypothetical protein
VSKGARRLARALAAVIVHEGLAEAEIASLLLPVCERGDLGAVLKRELRQAAGRRERMIRQASRPARQEPGFADLDTSGLVTVLGSPPPSRPVNGHAFDVSRELWPLKPRTDAD